MEASGKRETLKNWASSWGYFVIYNTLINFTLIFGISTIAGIIDGDLDLTVFGLAGLAVGIAIVYFSFRRKRWALILSTILSFNILWMIINISYFSNRWAEFKSETMSDTTTAKLKALPKEVRLSIFLAIAWGFLVPSYVLLFDPYGRMNDQEVAHMLGVIFLPMLIGLGLFFFYRKFVR